METTFAREGDTGKLRRVRRNNGGILPLTAHHKYPKEEFVAEPGGVHWGRGEGYLHGLLPPSPDFSGLSGGGVLR